MATEARWMCAAKALAHLELAHDVGDAAWIQEVREQNQGLSPGGLLSSFVKPGENKPKTAPHAGERGVAFEAARARCADDADSSESRWEQGFVAFGVETSYYYDEAGLLWLRTEGDMEDVDLFFTVAVIREVALFSEWVPLLTHSSVLRSLDFSRLCAHFSIGVSNILERDCARTRPTSLCLFVLPRERETRLFHVSWNYDSLRYIAHRSSGEWQAVWKTTLSPGVLRIAACNNSADDGSMYFEGESPPDANFAGARVKRCVGPQGFEISLSPSFSFRETRARTIPLLADLHKIVSSQDATDWHGTPLPPRYQGWVTDRMRILAFNARIRYDSATSQRCKICVCLDLRINLPRSLLDLFMKRLAGIFLYLWRRTAQSVASNEDGPHRAAINSDRAFYEHWLLPKYLEFANSKGWAVTHPFAPQPNPDAAPEQQAAHAPQA